MCSSRTHLKMGLGFWLLLPRDLQQLSPHPLLHLLLTLGLSHSQNGLPSPTPFPAWTYHHHHPSRNVHLPAHWGPGHRAGHSQPLSCPLPQAHPARRHSTDPPPPHPRSPDSWSCLPGLEPPPAWPDQGSPSPARQVPKTQPPRGCSSHLKEGSGNWPLWDRDHCRVSPHIQERETGVGPTCWLDLGGPLGLTRDSAAQRGGRAVRVTTVLGASFLPAGREQDSCQASLTSRAPGPVPGQSPLRAAWLYDFTG